MLSIFYVHICFLPIISINHKKMASLREALDSKLLKLLDFVSKALKM